MTSATARDDNTPTRATSGPGEARECRIEGCEVQVILAQRGPRGPWRPYEAADVPPRSLLAEVIVGESLTAWRPADLVEDVVVRKGWSEDAAWRFVDGHPWHRPHRHHYEHTTTRQQETR